MKKAIVTIISLLCPAICVNFVSGAVLQFSATDQIGEASYEGYCGDIASVVVTINTDLGSYTVDWYASSFASFQGPMRFEISLFNGRELVVLSDEIPAIETDHFSYGEEDLGDLFANWSENDQISTVGYDFSSGIPVYFTSGIYPTEHGTTPCDSIEAFQFPIVISDQENLQIEDSDGDGIYDYDLNGEELDKYANSDIRSTVFFLGKDTRIPNEINGALATSDGYTLADMISVLHEDAESNSRGRHGQYVQHMVRNLKLLVKDGLLTQSEFVGLVRQVAQSR